MSGGPCVAGGMCGRGHVWQGGVACMTGGHEWGGMRAGGMHGGGHVWQGFVSMYQRE